MDLKKTNILIGAFIIFWIIVIGWGAFKTFKMTKPKGPPVPATVSKKITPKETPPKPTKKEPETVPPTTTQPEVRPVLVRVFKVKATDFQDILPVMGTVKGKTENP